MTLRDKILLAATVTIEPKDPEVVRNKQIVHIPIDDLMDIISSETFKLEFPAEKFNKPHKLGKIIKVTIPNKEDK